MNNWIRTVVGVLVALLVSGSLVPEATAADIMPIKGSPVTIKDVDVRYVKTPVYDADGHAKAKAEQYWLRMVVEYQISKLNDGWLDDVRVDWAVGLNRAGKKPALLRLSVSYADVEADGGSHHAVAYLRPAVLERYGRSGKIGKSDLHLYAEIYVAGRLAAGYHDSSNLTVRDRWWLDGGERTELLQNVLLSRLETPFAPLDYDFYEHIIPPKN